MPAQTWQFLPSVNISAPPGRAKLFTVLEVFSYFRCSENVWCPAGLGGVQLYSSSVLKIIDGSEIVKTISSNIELRLCYLLAESERWNLYPASHK